MSSLKAARCFSKVFTEAINDALKSILGESVAKALFYHLKVEVEEVPGDPSRFAVELENIFGEGASLIERSIIKNLYSKLGLEYQKINDFEFADYIEYARKKQILKLEGST